MTEAEPTVFVEPGVLRAVDLDELAETRAPRAGWVAAPRPLRPRHPERGRDHPAPQRLHGEREAVVLGELLVRERRAKVGVPLAHERHRAVARRGRQPPIARTVPPA